MTVRRVAVVGAGVGGLAVAAALRRRGSEVTVFEQARHLRREGTGLGLWTNATAALRDLGLSDVLDGIAEPLERLVALSGRDGRPLAEVRLDRTARRYRAPSVNVQRAELLETLAGAVGDGAIRYGARCAGFEQDAGGVSVRFADGTRARSDLLVAADGAGSTVRSTIRGESAPGAPQRWLGWQGVAQSSPDGLPERTGLFVLSGPSLVGLYPLTRDRVHWFMDDPDPSTAPDPTADERLSKYVEAMPAVVREVVAATPPDSLVYDEVRDLPLRPRERWGEGRVTLLGDAAHPMLPTLGQGACQALEDAAVLVRCLEERRDDPETALRLYERARSSRAAGYVRASRLSADLRRRAPAPLRDPLLRATPSRLVSLLFNTTIRPA